MKMYLEGATNGFLAAHDRLHGAIRDGLHVEEGIYRSARCLKSS